MVTLRPVQRAPRTVSDEPVDNDYTPIVKELRDARDKGDKLEAVIEADEFPEGTEAKAVRLEINRTARSYNIPLNFKTAKNEWPIIFSVSVPRATEDEAEAEAPKASTGKAA